MALFGTVDEFLRSESIYETLALDPARLATYVGRVEGTYGDYPYHCLEHVQHVVRTVVHLWTSTELGEIVRGVSPEDYAVLALATVIACTVHDAGHLGLTNDFLIRTHHPYAIDFNDSSPNESHHAATAFKILFDTDNFLDGQSAEKFWLFRRTVISLVLGTDMSKHHATVSQLRSRDLRKIGTADVTLLLVAVVKCADLSHVFLPYEEHLAWSRRLQRELFLEGDRWCEKGWQPPSLMRRGSDADFAGSQLAFLRYVVIPLVESLVPSLPATVRLVDAVERNCEAWKERQTILA